MKVGESLSGKVVMVTGGTGSFGHQITSTLISLRPREIRIFSRDEKKQDDMRREYGDCGTLVRFVIGDVRDLCSLRRAMQGVDYVFHAAAMKQVPNCEYNVYQAILTNAVGAQNIVEAAYECGVRKVIAVSTDKAVKPVNVMGMTKALQERIMISANYPQDEQKHGKSRTVFACVRYGNVVGSRGSVIPLFRSQLEQGVPLTLTSPEMTRFVITLPQAIGLVLYAVENAVGGEVFVIRMPSIRIKDLAEVMRQSSGSRSPIIHIGVRPGEKIHEVLISEEEAPRTVQVSDNVYCILPSINLPVTERRYKGCKKFQGLRYSSGDNEFLDPPAIERLLYDTGWLPIDAKAEVAVSRS